MSDVFLDSTLISKVGGVDALDDYVEVPGVCQGGWNSSSEPIVNLHAKLVRFFPVAPLVKYIDGKFCRRLSILGSDGEIYHFAVVSATDQLISSMVRIFFKLRKLMIIN